MKNTRKERLQKRVRAKLRRLSVKPRLSVFRSNKYMYAQIIDAMSGKTLFGVSEKVVGTKAVTKTERAKDVGVALARKAVEKKVKEVVFDKGSYAFHGRVKALADGAREGGLQF